MEKSYFRELQSFLVEERKKFTVFPKEDKIFEAFNLCPLDKVKIVILGQDPYHKEGQAHGLSFSVPYGIVPPPSLKNIYKELYSDLGVPVCSNGNLEKWAKQGVLLLNTALSVRAGIPGSHRKRGWEIFTDKIIELIACEKRNVVFMLWGNNAQEKEKLIDENKHLILKAAHPSPLARGAFSGCKHFSKADKYLISHSISPIDWNLTEEKWNLFQHNIID